MPNPAQPFSLLVQSDADAVKSTSANEDSPNRAANSDDRLASGSFNSFYQEFVGVPLEIRERRHKVYLSPAFAKTALAGTSAFLTVLVVAHALMQDAPAPPTYTYREPASSEQNSSSRPAIPTVVAQLALSKPESQTVPLRPAQPTRNFSSAGGLQLPQPAPPESLVVTPLRLESTDSAVASAPDYSVPSAPTNTTPSIASLPNQSSQPAEEGSLLGAVAPASLPALAQANGASPETPQIDPQSPAIAPSIAPPSAIVDRSSLAASPVSVENNSAAATETTPTQPSLSSRSTESVSSTAGQSIHDFIAVFKQGTTPRILPLSGRAALEVAQADRIDAFRIVRLPRSVYQNIWLSLQAESKTSSPTPIHGFADHQQQIIVLPMQ